MFGLGIFDALASIAKSIITGIVDVCVFLFTHPLFLGAVIVAIVGLFLYIKNEHHIHVLEQEIVSYQQQKVFWDQSTAIYKSNTRLLEQVNKENQETLKILSTTTALANKAKADLERANSAAKSKITILENQIRNSSAKDNGPIAPVLKNTIEEIDAIRADRNTLWRKK